MLGKELARFSLLDIVNFPEASLMAMCVGKNIINNPRAIREDDIITGDIVFYELDTTEGILKKEALCHKIRGWRR